MKKALKWIGIIFVALFVAFMAIGIFADDPDTDTAKKPETVKTTKAEKKTTPKTQATPKQSPTDWANKIEAYYLDSLGYEFKNMCNSDNAYTHWGCFYDGVSADHIGTLWIELNTDGGWSAAEQKQLAQTAARHWFNFTGEKFTNLDTIVVKVNGRDYNNYRSDVPHLK